MNDKEGKSESKESLISHRPHFQLFAAVIPFIAITLGLYVFKSAPVAIGIYYFVILCVVAMCSPVDLFKSLFVGWNSLALIIFVVVTALAGPAILFFWSRAMLDGIVLSDVLAQYGIDPVEVRPIAMAALINPIVEEIYWRGCLLKKTIGPCWIDVAFGAYHVPVLMLVIKPPFIVGVFIVLVCTAWAFRLARLKTGGLMIPWIGHAVADVAIAWAVWQIIRSTG